MPTLHKRLSLILTCFFILTSHCLSGEPAKPGKPTLEKAFQRLMKDYGKSISDEVTIVSGPVAVKMNRGGVPGREWSAKLGDITFKISIEDKVKLEAKDLTDRLKRIPPAYRKAYQIVSEEKKNGVAVYADLDGAAAHGSKDYLNIIPKANGLVIAHESGHILEQKATQSDPKTLEHWKEATKTDAISVSPYGDQVAHEDLAEFARIYAVCLNAGADHLAELKKLSPMRYEQWEKILAIATK